MSCNGCRVMRKGCSDSCILRPCLQWINNGESQANATVFLAKFYGRKGLMNLISNGPLHSRPALFRSLLYEACGRILNPVSGSLGLLCSGNWGVCQAGVESILAQGSDPFAEGNDSNRITPKEHSHSHDHDPDHDQHVVHGALIQSRAGVLHKVNGSGKFKCVDHSRKGKLIPNIKVSGDSNGTRKTPQKAADIAIYSDRNVFTRAEDKCPSKFKSMAEQPPDDLTARVNHNTLNALNPKVEALYLNNSDVKLELELRLGIRGDSAPPES